MATADETAVQDRVALIIGTGSGFSASLARRFAAAGMRVAVASRNPDQLKELCTETGARAYPCDATSLEETEALFGAVDIELGTPHLVVYNPSARAHGPFTELDPEAVERALRVTCYGGFLTGQAAAKRMLANKKEGGAIFLTGATASVKGYPHSAAFAMGKFALRGLAQSMARELSPQGIHVAHIIIDGGIRNEARGRVDPGDDHFLHPDAIADTCWHLYRQHRSSWTWEIEVRPWVERF